VVVKTIGGEVMAKVLDRQTTKAVALLSLNPEHENRTIPKAEVEWVARVIWASQ
jgi:phage repressor protein C with HTH and peptisase S24 domain